VDSASFLDLKYVGGRRAEQTINSEVKTEYTYDTDVSGLKVKGTQHTDANSPTTVLDERENMWDANYNRTSRDIRAGPASLQTTHNYGYDELDRMETGSSTANYTLDAAGNRTDASYALTGTGEKLHQYASTPAGDFGYDAAGRLSDRTTAGRSYRYDALGRLKELVNSATGVVPGNTAFLNQSTTVSGTWIEENDYIRESSAGAGRLLWTNAPVDLTKFELRFWRVDTAPTPPPEPYGPEHYAQVLLRAFEYGPGTNEHEWRFLALTIQPDGVFLREWNEDEVDELGGVEVDIPDGVWHDLTIELKGDDEVTVKLDLDGATDVETIEATTGIPPGGDAGLGVGESAEFRFKDIKTDQPVAASVALRYHYDIAGRVVGRTLDPGGANDSQFFIYDDDRIMLELDGNGAVIAEWVYGVYIDEIIAMYRNTDGQPGYDETYYYIQDDLFNVVALTDANGVVVERYSYDDYGYPTIYDGAGVARQDNETAYGNIFLFNGRRWDETLELYDYRTRYYDPAMGRFLRIDTIGPWGDNNNLGNAYAYVGNNPWTHNDPYGTLSIEEFVAGAGGFFAGGYDAAIRLPGQTVSAIGNIGKQLYFAGTDAVESGTVHGFGSYYGVEVFADDINYRGIYAQNTNARLLAGESSLQAGAHGLADFGIGIVGFVTGYTIATEMKDAQVAFSNGEIDYEEYLERISGAAGNQAGGTVVAYGATKGNTALRNRAVVVKETPKGNAALRGRAAAVSETSLASAQLIGKVSPPEGVFGTTTFGNAMHLQIADFLQQKYPGVSFRFAVRPGERGIDVEVLGRGSVTTGYRYADIKPRSVSGKRSLENQVWKWNLSEEVRAITYDAKGNIYHGF